MQPLSGSIVALVTPMQVGVEPETALDELVINSPSPFQGAKVSNLSPALADELRIDPTSSGVVVTDVSGGSPAQRLGFQRGDLIVSVNNAKIGKTRDLERAANQQSRAWRITILRGGRQMSVELRG